MLMPGDKELVRQMGVALRHSAHRGCHYCIGNDTTAVKCYDDRKLLPASLGVSVLDPGPPPPRPTEDGPQQPLLIPLDFSLRLALTAPLRILQIPSRLQQSHNMVGSLDLPPISLPYGVNPVRGKEAADVILSELVLKPQNAIYTLRKTFEAEQKAGTSFGLLCQDDLPLQPFLSSFFLRAYVISDYLVLAPLHRGQIYTFTEAGGLLDLYQDAFSWAGLFSIDQPEIIEMMLTGFAALIQYIEDRKVLKRVLLRAPAVWTNIWLHRDEFALWVYEDSGDVKKGARSPTINLMIQYEKLYASEGVNLLFSTHVAHLALYILATYKGAFGKLQGYQELVVVTGATIEDDGHAHAAETGRLIREAVIETVGLDPFVARLGEIVQEAHETLDCQLVAGAVCVVRLLSYAHSIDIMPYLARHQILRSLITTVTDSKLIMLPVLSILPTLFTLLEKIMKYCFDRKNFVVRGEDMVALVATYADINIGRNQDRVRSAEEAELCESHITARLEDCYATAREVNEGQRAAAFARPFVHGMKAGARIHWYPTLARLRKAKHRNPADRVHVRSLIELWMGFGAILGLDADQERRRHEGEAARAACSWRDCSRRDQPGAGNDGANLKKCAGCGEKYCSRECQLSDWKEGGHKQRCKRLKN
ncbi:unnamed protein product [Peniophora sp. CBMAI 1063]|nr:unnamed protein product [Peniophora sp. CBMAI 1063]